MWQVRRTDDWAPRLARLGLAMVMLPHGAQKAAFGWFGGEGFQATIRSLSEQDTDSTPSRR